MAFTHRGEFEVEIGLGLPRMTTAQRVAYVPSRNGMQVFDTDLLLIATYVNGWILAGTAEDLSAKVDTVTGKSINSLTMTNNADASVIVMSPGSSESGVSTVPDTSIYADSAAIFSADGLTFVPYTDEAKTDPALARTLGVGDDITAKTSGKWYWETILTGNNVVAMLSIHKTPVQGAETADYTEWLVDYHGFRADARRYSSVGGTTSNNNSGGVAFNNGGIVQHHLDLDSLIYYVTLNGNPTQRFPIGAESGTPLTAGEWRPSASINNNIGDTYSGEITMRFAPADLTYAVPVGYSTFDPSATFRDGNNVTGAAIEATTGNTLVAEVAGASSLTINDTNIVSATSIDGVEGTDDSSFVTRNSAGRYQEAFVIADWSGTTLTVTAATHGLPFTASDAYDVEVYEIDGGISKIITIESSTNATTGDVTITTAGDTFDGRIQISR